MGRIICFGELMIRLTPPGYKRFVQTESFAACFGGAEANVAVSLVNFGHRVGFVTKLPEHELGQAAVNELRRYGVSTDLVIRGGDRLGLYFLEQGAAPRGAKVIYDRGGSAFAQAEPGEFNWAKIFHQARWFHLTGITPALSAGCRASALEALKTAKARGIMISLDLNYRSKLWPLEEARAVLAELAGYCDLLIANGVQAGEVFGLSCGGDLDRIAAELGQSFSLKKIALTHREPERGWSARLYESGQVYRSPGYELAVVEGVGGGDAFAAGLIHGLISAMPAQEALAFGAAAAALKYTVTGDFNQVSAAEVRNLMAGEQGGRIQR